MASWVTLGSGIHICDRFKESRPGQFQGKECDEGAYEEGESFTPRIYVAVIGYGPRSNRKIELWYNGSLWSEHSAFQRKWRDIWAWFERGDRKPLMTGEWEARYYEGNKLKLSKSMEIIEPRSDLTFSLSDFVYSESSGYASAKATFNRMPDQNSSLFVVVEVEGDYNRGYTVNVDPVTLTSRIPLFPFPSCAGKLITVGGSNNATYVHFKTFTVEMPNEIEGYPPSDPCEGITCENVCVGFNLHSQKCVGGVCVTDALIEVNSTQCEFIPVCTPQLLGDVNGDGVVDQADADLLFNWISFPNLRETTYKLACPENADVTGDGTINIGDAVLLANHVKFPGDPAYAFKRYEPEPTFVCTEGEGRYPVMCMMPDASGKLRPVGSIPTEVCRNNEWVPSEEECPEYVEPEPKFKVRDAICGIGPTTQLKGFIDRVESNGYSCKTFRALDFTFGFGDESDYELCEPPVWDIPFGTPVCYDGRIGGVIVGYYEPYSYMVHRDDGGLTFLTAPDTLVIGKCGEEPPFVCTEGEGRYPVMCMMPDASGKLHNTGSRFTEVCRNNEWVPSDEECPEYVEPKPEDLCAGITCENVCVGADLYAQKCEGGVCVPDALIEANCPDCPGYVPEPPRECNTGEKRSPLTCWDGSSVYTEICEEDEYGGTAWVASGEQCPMQPITRVMEMAVPEIVYVGQSVPITVQTFCGAAASSGEPITLQVDNVAIRTKTTLAGTTDFRWVAEGVGMRKVCAVIPINPNCPVPGVICKTITVSAKVADIAGQIKEEKERYEADIERLRELREEIRKRPAAGAIPGRIFVPPSLAGQIVLIGGKPITVPPSGISVPVVPGENEVVIVTPEGNIGIEVDVPSGGGIDLPVPYIPQPPLPQPPFGVL